MSRQWPIEGISDRDDTMTNDEFAGWLLGSDKKGQTLTIVLCADFSSPIQRTHCSRHYR